MHYFIKVTQQDQHPVFRLLLEKPLRLAVLILGAQRTWQYPKPSPEGLVQGEFKLAYNDYPIFWLKLGSKKQLARAIEWLIKYGMLVKTDKKVGLKRINVYRLQTLEIIAPYFYQWPSNGHQTTLKRPLSDTQAAWWWPSKDTQPTPVINRYQKKEENREIDTRIKKAEVSPKKFVKGDGLEGGKSYQAQMQLVESQGQEFVDIWNQTTGREDRMQKSVKQGLFDLIPGVSLDKFRYRVAIYEQVRTLCEQHKLDRYLTFPVADFDLSEFLANINSFQQKDAVNALEKRIKADHKKAVLRKVRPKTNEEKTAPVVLPSVVPSTPTLTHLDPHSYQGQLLRKLTEVSRAKNKEW